VALVPGVSDGSARQPPPRADHSLPRKLRLRTFRLEHQTLGVDHLQIVREPALVAFLRKGRGVLGRGQRSLHRLVLRRQRLQVRE
jgi:hypothetical protein